MKGGGQRKFQGPPSNRRKDIDDQDLILFREMHKREKDRVVSLLQPVSDEFESNGNYPLYRMASAKKGMGNEFLCESEKNDYDWLKTPPATPLFPSLEMEATAPEYVVQREIPIMQPLSRFSGKSEATPKASINIAVSSKSPSPKQKVHLRSVTPSQRQTASLHEMKNTKGKPMPNQKLNQLNKSVDLTKIPNMTTKTSKSDLNQRHIHLNFLAANLSKNISTDSKTKPKSRGVSPLVRPKTPAQITGFSDETPPNLRIDRSSSTTRGRSGNQTTMLNNNNSSSQKPETPLNLRTDRSSSTTRGRSEYQTTALDNTNNNTSSQKPELTPKIRRQSCSPSVTRGRKVEQKQESEGKTASQKSRIQTGGSGTQVFGSSMVDKLMNARKSSNEERETNPKIGGGSINEGSGFGRLMSKSSLDMALKHMDMKKDPINFRQAGATTRRSSASINSSRPSNS